GLLNDGREDIGRQVSHRARDFFANVLGGAFYVALEQKLAGDSRAAFGRHRVQFVETADRADRFFKRKDYLSRDFFGCSARQSNVYCDGSRIGFGKEINSE